MAGQHAAHRLAERAGALAVHEPHVGDAGHERVVEILLDQVARLVGRAADQQSSRGATAGSGRSRLAAAARRDGAGRPLGRRAATGTRTRDRARRTVAESPAIATSSPRSPEVLGGDGHAGRQRARRGAGRGRRRRHAGARLAQRAAGSPSSAGRDRSPRLSRSHSALTARRTSVSSAAASALARSTISRARAAAVVSASWAAASRAALSRLAPLDGDRALGLGPGRLVEPGEELAHARGVRRAVALGAGDQLGRQPEPRRRWRARSSGPGRRSAAGTSAPACGCRTRRRRCGRAARWRRRRLSGSRWVVADDEGAPIGQRLEDRLGQRRALVGIGAGAQLVEEHQRARRPRRPAPRGPASRTPRRSRGSRPPPARRR